MGQETIKGSEKSVVLISFTTSRKTKNEQTLQPIEQSIQQIVDFVYTRLLIF